MSGMPSNGGAPPGAGGPGGTPGGLGGGVPDAAAKHKQLSELLRASSTSSITGPGLNSASPQPGGMGPQLGTPLGKSPLGQGSPNNHPSPQAQKAGTPTGVAGQSNNNNTATMGLNTTGFNQAMINNSQGHAGLLAQGGQPKPGQVMNGGLGPEAGRGRGAGVAGMQYQGQAMQGAAPGSGGAGSALAETLTQGGQQMGAHTTLSAAQQAGNMNKVSHLLSINTLLHESTCTCNIFLTLICKLHRIINLQFIKWGWYVSGNHFNIGHMYVIHLEGSRLLTDTLSKLHDVLLVLSVSHSSFDVWQIQDKVSPSPNVVDLSQLETQVDASVNPGCTFDNCMLLNTTVEHNHLMTSKMPFYIFTTATQQKLKTTSWYFHCVQTWFCFFSKKKTKQKTYCLLFLHQKHIQKLSMECIASRLPTCIPPTFRSWLLSTHTVGLLLEIRVQRDKNAASD